MKTLIIICFAIIMLSYVYINMLLSDKETKKKWTGK